MNKRWLAILTFLSAGLFFCFSSLSYSQSAAPTIVRSFVSAAGTDSTSCTFTAPCRTLNAAIAATASGGEVYCLTSGGYGSVTITKSIQIVCTSVEAAVTAPSGGTAVTIAAGATDGVTLQGLHISGAGVGGIGVDYQSGGVVLIDHCFISGFLSGSGTGVNSSGTRLSIKDSTIVANLVGINVTASASTGAIVTGTFIGGNGSSAINLNGATFGAAMSIDKSQITGNAAALKTSGAASVGISGSQVSGNAAFFNTSGGGGVFSYGNNQFSNNATSGPNTSGYTSIGAQ